VNPSSHPDPHASNDSQPRGPRSRDEGPSARRDGYRAEHGVVDPRSGAERRAAGHPKPVASEAGAADEFRTLTGLERRRGAGRRRSDFTRAAEEGELTPEQFLFVKAIDEFKRANDKIFPSWTDVLEVIRLLGYRKTMPSELAIPAAEDWNERPDTPANVRPFGWERRFKNDQAQHDHRREAA
jgi:hypothetical protein